MLVLEFDFRMKTDIKRLIISLMVFLGSVMCHAQERMMPGKIATDLRRDYETSLMKSLGVGHGDVVYLVKSSAEPEYCLYYDAQNKSLVYSKAEKNIWRKWCSFANMHGAKTQVEVDAKRKKVTIDDEVAQALIRLYKAVIYTASYFGEDQGTDGEKYQFLLSRGNSSIAECRTPDGNSNCGKAVALMERLCVLVEDGNKEAVNQMLDEINQVIDTFEELFPEEIGEEGFLL